MSNVRSTKHRTAGAAAADVLIVGAGLCGLVAARELRAAGRRVLLVDKGRGVGGRMATRRIDEAAFDHGAQCFAPRDPHVSALAEAWAAAGALAAWAGPEAGGARSWRGVPGMTGMAKHLARDLEVRLASRVTALRRGGDGWIADTDGGEALGSGAVLLTAPVPQSLALLDAGGIELDAAQRADLETVNYEPCLAVLAVPAGEIRLPAAGWLAPGDGKLAAIIDNRAKGVSSRPAVTLLAAPGFSRANWDRDRKECGRELLAAAEPWLGCVLPSFQVHGWLYSRPLAGRRDGCLRLHRSPDLVIAGDAFGGPDLEGAALSGLCAARELCPDGTGPGDAGECATGSGVPG